MAATCRRWLDRALRAQSLTAAAVIAGFCTLAIGGVRFGPDMQLGILLTGIVLIGFPHGAFDHLVARPILSRSLGQWWRLIFLAVYLGLAAAVWLAWMVAPAVTLIGFLVASALHFGLGDIEDGLAPVSVPRSLAVLTYGTLPLLLPIVLHPADTAPILAALGGIEPQVVLRIIAGGTWLVAIWLALFVWLCIAGWREQRGIVESIVAALGFLVLSPLLAFALYFTLWHSVRHVLRLGAWHDDRDFRAAFRWVMRTLVPAGIVCAVGVAGLSALGEPTIIGLLVPVFRVIAALTLPHMIVTTWLSGPAPAAD
jgi:Brp/Blh family beta-carotene 15,15'-monooxygenase